jgi:hypothetical protein
MAPHRLHLYRTEGRDLRRYLTGRDESFQMFLFPSKPPFAYLAVLRVFGC